MTLRSQREKEVRDLEEKLRKADVKYVMETTSLVTTNKCQGEEHRMQITLMKTKHEAEMAERQEKIEGMREELMKTQARLEQETSQLKERLQMTEEQRDETATEFKNSNREKDTLIASLQSQLTQLKTYIGDTQAGNRSTSQRQIESDKQHKKIKDLERDLVNQKSAVQLLNIRLTSSTEIFVIQESELARVKGDSSDTGKKLQMLLTRWREKVFELLVQLKTQDLVEENITRNHNWQVTDLEEKILSLQNKGHLLEHTIADRDAQLQLARERFSLQDELISVQQVAEILDGRLNGYEEAMPHLASLLQSFKMKHKGYQDKLTGVTSKLASFDHRISFAVGRIEILKGLLARKDAIWQLREKEIHAGCQQQPSDGDKMDDKDCDNNNHRLSYEQLETELQQVTHERDALATRIQRDTKTMQQQYDAIKEKFESKQEQDASRIQELEFQIQQRSKSLQSISDKLDRTEAECQESNRTISKLKTELAKVQLSTERASAEKMAAVESQLTNQLAEMEHRLNDARREQAKAVVCLRQLERQMGRERERSAEILRTQEEHLGLEMERVTSQLRQAEKDRNLLMATLKQEGLIGQYKAQRATARGVDCKMENTTQNLTSEDAASATGPTSQTRQRIKQKAPLSAILMNLQSLTAEVLKDDDDDSNGDDIENTVKE